MKKTYRQFPVLRKQIIDEATEKKKKTLEKQFFLMAAIYCQDFHEFIQPKTAASELEFSQEIEAWLRRNRRMSNYQLCHDCYKRIKSHFSIHRDALTVYTKLFVMNALPCVTGRKIRRICFRSCITQVKADKNIRSMLFVL